MSMKTCHFGQYSGGFEEESQTQEYDQESYTQYGGESDVVEDEDKATDKELASFKHKILLVHEILGDKAELVTVTKNTKKSRISSSRLDDESLTLGGREFIKIKMNNKVERVFDNYYSELKGDAGSVRCSKELIGPCKGGAMPPFPNFGFRYYEMAEPSFANHAPRVNDQIKKILTK